MRHRNSGQSPRLSARLQAAKGWHGARGCRERLHLARHVKRRRGALQGRYVGRNSTAQAVESSGFATADESISFNGSHTMPTETYHTEPLFSAILPAIPHKKDGRLSQ